MFIIKALLVVLLLATNTSQGLRCWECQQASNNAECLLTGKSVRCIGLKDSCWTLVRRYKTQSLIWKGCKQGLACESDKRQNFFDGLMKPGQCNDDQDSSLCTCCCSNSMCNRQGTCKLRNCPMAPSPFRNGAVKCSDSNKPGSICEFTCTGEEFTLQPSPEAASSRCLPGGKWSQPEQCCAKPCPPYLPMDYIVLLHSQDQETLDFYTEAFGHSILTTYKHGPESLRIALIQFSGVPHPEKAVTLNQTARMDAAGVLRASGAQRHVKTADGKVNIGAALTYALDLLRRHVRDPNRHVEVVDVTTDAMSDDDVTGPAQALRDVGVLVCLCVSLCITRSVVLPTSTFVRFVRPDNRKPYNMKQLLEIAGDKNRVSIIDKNAKPDRDNNLFLQSYVCDKICRLY